MTTTATKQDKDSKPPAKTRSRKTPTVALSVRGATGPRTKRGKMKSRYNAVKHGIFAKVVLGGRALAESKADYVTLLESLHESVEPVGGLEELLVENLAQIAWRKARVVRAEAAAIAKQTEFFRVDREAHLKEVSEGSMLALAQISGMARKRDNPYLLSKSIQRLEILGNVISDRGFEPKTDEGILQTLYGESGKADGLYLTYRVCAESAATAAQKEEGSAIEAEKKRIVQAIDHEINYLEGHIGDLEARETQELPLKEERLAIPKEKELERLMRYEAHLDRAFDRTLGQLERFQRMRLGLATLPPVKVELSR